MGDDAKAESGGEVLGSGKVKIWVRDGCATRWTSKLDGEKQWASVSARNHTQERKTRRTRKKHKGLANVVLVRQVEKGYFATNPSLTR